MTVEITGSTLRVWGAGCVPGTPGPAPLPAARSLYGRGLFIVGLLAGTW